MTQNNTQDNLPEGKGRCALCSLSFNDYVNLHDRVTSLEESLRKAKECLAKFYNYPGIEWEVDKDIIDEAKSTLSEIEKDISK